MSKNITISEGDVAKVFTGVKKITTAKSGGSGFVDWVPEDEAINYVDLDTLDVYENGTYTASGEGCQAFSGVNVNVQPDLTTKGIDTNGTYNASDDGAQGYSSVTVDVKANVGKGTFTRNGTFHSSDAHLDGYHEVVVNVPGSGGPISGVEVSGIAVNNLSAGQSVHVYQNDVTTEEGITVYPQAMRGWVVGSDYYYIQYSEQLRRKSAANISEESPYEQVLPSNLKNLGIAFPFIAYQDQGNNIYLTSFFNLSKRVHVANDNTFNGIQQGNGFVSVSHNNWAYHDHAEIYDSGLNKVASCDYSSYGTDVRPLDANRYINSRGFGNGGGGSYGISTYSGDTQYYNTHDDELYLLTQLGNYVYFYKANSLYRVILGQTEPSLILTMEYETYPNIRCADNSGRSNANGYTIISTDKESYQLNADGSYRKLPVFVDARTCITGMDTGFISGARLDFAYDLPLTYYPFGDGGIYIQGTGSKNARGQLGVAKSSASSGSKATAIVLFR